MKSSSVRIIGIVVGALMIAGGGFLLYADKTGWGWFLLGGFLCVACCLDGLENE